MCSTWNFLRPDFRRKNGENSPRGAVTLQRSGFFSTFNITTSYFPSHFSLFPFRVSLCFFFPFFSICSVHALLLEGGGNQTHDEDDEFSFDVEHRTAIMQWKFRFILRVTSRFVPEIRFLFRNWIVKLPKAFNSLSRHLWNSVLPLYTRTSSSFENIYPI